ncbi:MAG: hypothetical protein L0220_03025, partial [Acidobacteria bacterium]|nr:hypothetical protein [Acidobacteriota bacterium]
METFIRVEAVNIVASVFDTDQLSVIRGSSLLLKKAIRHIKNELSESLEALSTGASLGLFRLKGNPSKITEVIKKIRLKLGENPYEYFVFLVEYCEARDLLAANEKLLTQLRFHQMRSITVVPDQESADHKFLNRPCGLEGRRIAASDAERLVQGPKHQLSRSVCNRLDFGRESRQDVYFQELDPDSEKIDKLRKYRFSDDLESLAGSRDDLRLNNKIAVIYIDGNKFSAIQRQTVEWKQPPNQNEP